MASIVRTGVAAAVALALVGALACGDDRAKRYAEARERVQKAQEEVARATERVQEQERRFEEAKQALEAARETLREKRDALAQAEARAAEYADDTLLFRTVQARLLEDDALEDAAVSASVEGGVVTLSGTVPSEALRDRAVAVARETAGVVDVRSRIEIAAADAARGTRGAAPAAPAPGEQAAPRAAEQPPAEQPAPEAAPAPSRRPDAARDPLEGIVPERGAGT